MRGRYVAILRGNAAARDAVLTNIKGAALKIAIDQPDFLLATEDQSRLMLIPRGEGAVLGNLFEEGSCRKISSIEGGFAHTIPMSGGSVLVNRLWGDFVAFVRHPASRELSVVRAPFASTPCIYFWRDDSLVVGSDLEMLKAAEWRNPGIDWGQVVHHLSFRDLRRARTCLTDLVELRGGERISLNDAGSRLDQLWDPWDYVSRQNDRNETGAARAIREAVVQSVSSTIADKEHPLLLLSGGLDSSIVAASLAASGRRFTSLNMSSQEVVGDERNYARLTAKAFESELIERHWQVEDVAITRSAAAGFPNPIARSFMQGSDRLIRQAVQQSGADIVIDGGGGDNVFCALQSSAPVCDAMHAPGVRMHDVARNIAQIAGVTVPHVLLDAFRRALFRRGNYRWPIDRHLLNRGLVGNVRADELHPWLRAPGTGHHGSAAYIALLVAAQSWAERFEGFSDFPRTSPLVTRPVIEACLRVPTWSWFADGLNRSVARRAFAPDLPSEIINRRSKGSPDGFVARLFERNRPAIREMLMEGRLRTSGVIDVVAVEHILTDAKPAGADDYRRIMKLVDVEAWARGF